MSELIYCNGDKRIRSSAASTTSVLPENRIDRMGAPIVPSLADYRSGDLNVEMTTDFRKTLGEELPKILSNSNQAS